MNTQDIEQLIQRYMDGQTTLAEEEKLAKALRTSNDPRWKPYRQMFDFIEDGCPAKTTPRRTRTIITRWITTGIAAAIIMALFLIPKTTDIQQNTPIIAQTTTIPTPEPKTDSPTPNDIQQHTEEPSIINYQLSTINSLTRSAFPKQELSIVNCQLSTPPTLMVDDAATEEPDIDRYMAMTVDIEPEIHYEPTAAIDDSTLINHYIDLNLQLMDMRMRDIEYIITTLQQQDERTFYELTREF